LEPFALLPLEAMTCGTPVAGVKEGGVREHNTNQNRWLTQKEGATLAEAIFGLLLGEKKGAISSKNVVKSVDQKWP
jgi:glycosyltransferase involved in cell wall biosynthesis